jgi:hypothetical protein
MVWILSALASVQAASVGDIQAFYFVPTSQSSLVTSTFALQDGPVFLIQNTSASPITNGVLSILVSGDNATADSYNVGAIAAGANAYVGPGLTNDGGSHPAGGFFSFTGAILDTSDSGPSSNALQFQFTGLQGALAVISGIFTPATSLAPANDATIASMSFLGGPGNNDGPCNNCYGPRLIATLATPSSVPEPASVVMAGIAVLAGAGLWLALRRRAALA